MPTALLIELLHCPPIAWFADAIQAPGGLLLEAHEHYPKQTFRNRALILTTQGVKPLTTSISGSDIRRDSLQMDRRKRRG